MRKIGGKALGAVLLVLAMAAAVSPASANSSQRLPISSASSISTVTMAEATSLAGLVNASDYSSNIQGDVLRLYRAFFDREPDVGGAKYWIDLNLNGWSLDNITDFFTQSQEFANNYAGTTDREYLEAVYQNVLGRQYDQGGFDYWLDLLETGQLTRGGVVRWIAANKEFINRYPYLSADIGGHTLADALPLAGSTFFNEDRFGDSNWIGEMVGLIPTALSESNETPGTCYILIGTFAPTRFEEGFHVNSSEPDISLIAEGEEISQSFRDCDEDAVEDAGYESVGSNPVTLETDAPFYLAFFLPTTGPQTLDYVVIGDPDSTTATFFSPDTRASIPEPPNSHLGRNRFMDTAPRFDDTPFLYEVSLVGVEWTVVMGALVQSENTSSIPGTCVHFVGTITPNRIDEGTITTGTDTPLTGLLLDGRLIPAYFGRFQCEDGPAEAAGYSFIRDAKVGVGTTYPFYANFFIPAGTDIDAVVVGHGWVLPTTYFRVPPLATAYPAP